MCRLNSYPSTLSFESQGVSQNDFKVLRRFFVFEVNVRMCTELKKLKCFHTSCLIPRLVSFLLRPVNPKGFPQGFVDR